MYFLLKEMRLISFLSWLFGLIL